MHAADTINKRAILDYLRARESRDLRRLDELLAPDFKHLMLDREQDRAGLLAEVESTFTSGKYEIDVLVEQGDRVACRYRFTGVYADSKPVCFSGMFIANMRDGKLASGWGEYDSARLRKQIAG